MEYFIGMDAGGTKTESVLFDETGHILRRTVHPGCNPMDIGVDATRTCVYSAARELVDCAPGPVRALYGGIAGLDRVEVALDHYLGQHLPVAHIRTEDDGFNLISGTLGHVDGCGMVCGTGSSLFARIEGKPLVHIGGLGYLIDTGGSGFELGRDALKMAFRHLDGRGAHTVLTELLTHTLGRDPRLCMLEIYFGGRAYIASLARLVFQGLELGDPICGQLVDQGAYSLAELTIAAARHFPGEFTVVMSGGILTAYPHYAQLVREKASPMANMVLAQVPPVYGAAVEALWDCGIVATKAHQTRFMDDYRQLI